MPALRTAVEHRREEEQVQDAPGRWWDRQTAAPRVVDPRQMAEVGKRSRDDDHVGPMPPGADDDDGLLGPALPKPKKKKVRFIGAEPPANLVVPHPTSAGEDVTTMH